MVIRVTTLVVGVVGETAVGVVATVAVAAGLPTPHPSMTLVPRWMDLHCNDTMTWIRPLWEEVAVVAPDTRTGMAWSLVARVPRVAKATPTKARQAVLLLLRLPRVAGLITGFKYS